jgi:hypothetical protein
VAIVVAIMTILLPLLASISMRESGFVRLPVCVVLPLAVLMLMVLPVFPTLLEIGIVAIHVVVAIPIAIMVAVLQRRHGAERRSGSANPQSKS